jgi:hypothetical protein
VTTTTDSTGFYSFTGLVPGTYTVTFLNPPSGYNFEFVNLGTVGGAANGTVTASNTISQIVLSSGSAGINYDFAEVLAGS